jgi:hypothetical protein
MAMQARTVRTVMRYGDLRLQALSGAAGVSYVVTLDDAVSVGAFEALEPAVACFAAQHELALRGAATAAPGESSGGDEGAGPRQPEARPPNITDIEDYRRRRRR